MSEREPLVIEGSLRDCGDGCECAWLTLGGVMLDDLLPETQRLDSETQCATIAVELGREKPYSRQVGEVKIHNVPSWELERDRGRRHDFVFRDWGKVRVTIEWLEEVE